MDLSHLGRTGTCDLTTTGRRSGRPVRVEIWYVVVDGTFLVTGTPGIRNWLANLRADRRARLHLRNPGRVLDVLAEEVVDPARRRALVPEIWAAQPWYAQQPFSVEEWVAGAPMVTMRERSGHTER